MENEIIVPDMPYMRDIYKILRTGGFICEDSLSESTRRYYRKMDEHYDAYFKYFLQLGFYLERKQGYIHLTEARPAQATQGKLRTDIGNYLPWLEILVKFRPELAPGYQIKSFELQKFLDENDELRSLLPSTDDGQLASRVAKFLRQIAQEGFIDIGVDESTCLVTSAYNYLKEYILNIKLYGEHAKYNLSPEPRVKEDQQEEQGEQDIEQDHQPSLINETEE